jgi:hypothetical protein
VHSNRHQCDFEHLSGYARPCVSLSSMGSVKSTMRVHGKIGVDEENLRETECEAGDSQIVSAALRRDLHFPPLRALGRRPASRVARVDAHNRAIQGEHELGCPRDFVEARRLAAESSMQRM